MILTCEKGILFDNEYFVVRPQFFYSLLHPSNPDNLVWLKMIAWCTNTFGTTPPENISNDISNLRWYALYQCFWFREEKDREWFILRWS